MTMREIQAHLHKLYWAEMSPDLISRGTDAVLEEVCDWLNRPLDDCDARPTASKSGLSCATPSTATGR